MILNKTQKRKMLEVKKVIEDILEGNLKKYKITLYEANEIFRVYNNILCTEQHLASTISNNVKTFFERKGFYIELQGCGWDIGI